MTSTTNKMDEVNDLIEKAQHKEATSLLLSIIKATSKEQFPLFAEYGYDYASLLFEIQEYELCLLMFQSIYNFNYKKEEIITLLYDSFILPNNDEFKAAYDQQLIGYADHVIASHIPSYDDLPIDFIPYEEEKYLMFNKKLKVFEGFIDISKKALHSFIRIDNDNEFSDVVLGDHWNINTYKNCILSFKDRNIYFISTNIEATLSFFKLPGIMERYLSNLTFLDSHDRFQSYFHRNTSVYLPHIYYGNSSSGNSDCIEKILESEHQYRLTPEGRNTSNILLTIGIPSYNRGHRVLQNIRDLLQLQFDAEIEFVISNNGSTKYTEEYE